MIDHYYTLEEATRATGLEKHRLRYLEARFPKSINRRLFNDENRFYSEDHLQIFRRLDTLIRDNHPDIFEYDRINAGLQSRGRFMVVASGKGGVGKTTMAVNLACLGAKSGKRTLLIDGDLGLANTHVLLGLSPQRTLQDLVSKGLSVNEVQTESHFGLQVIAGGGSDFDLANLNGRGLELLTREILSTKRVNDWILLDGPAGIGASLLSWISAADRLLVVTTPSPTALLDAYGLIKVALEKRYSGEILVLVNMVSSLDQGQRTFEKLNQCSLKFLGHNLRYLGAVRKDLKIEHSLVRREPFCLGPEPSPAFRNLSEIANRLFQRER